MPDRSSKIILFLIGFFIIIIVALGGYYLRLKTSKTTPRVTKTSLTPTDFVTPQPEDPKVVPTEIQDQYPNGVLYTGTLETVGNNTLTLSTQSGIVSFTWVSGPVSNNTVFLILKPSGTPGVGQEFITATEFIRLPVGTKLQVLAENKDKHAYQVIIRQ